MIGKIQATLVSNAGILIRYKDIKVLMDGLYDDKGHVFSRMPKKIEEMVMNGDAPFDHIDYLIFSHRHLDHYCERKVTAYLKKHSVKRIFLPQECVAGRPIREFFAASQMAYTALSKATDEKVFSFKCACGFAISKDTPLERGGRCCTALLLPNDIR